MNLTMRSIVLTAGVIAASAIWAVSDYVSEPENLGKCGTSAQAKELCGAIIANGLARGDLGDLTGWRAKQRATNYANLDLVASDITSDGSVNIFDGRSLKVLIRRQDHESFEATLPIDAGAIPGGSRFTGTIHHGKTFTEQTAEGVVLREIVDICDNSLETPAGTLLLQSRADDCLLSGRYIAPTGNIDLGDRAEWYANRDIISAVSGNSI